MHPLVLALTIRQRLYGNLRTLTPAQARRVQQAIKDHLAEQARKDLARGAGHLFVDYAKARAYDRAHSTLGTVKEEFLTPKGKELMALAKSFTGSVGHFRGYSATTLYLKWRVTTPEREQAILRLAEYLTEQERLTVEVKDTVGDTTRGAPKGCSHLVRYLTLVIGP